MQTRLHTCPLPAGIKNVCITLPFFVKAIHGVIAMSHISEEIRPKFETLSIDLKNEILKRNVTLNTIHDLIRVLEDIVRESED